MRSSTINTPDSLTPRQQEVLNEIRRFQRGTGMSPTYVELSETIGISKVSVFEHVCALATKRYLQVVPHKARGIEMMESRERIAIEEAIKALRRMVTSKKPSLDATLHVLSILEAV